VYVHHEIVHTGMSWTSFARNGAIFVETVEEVPLGPSSCSARMECAYDGEEPAARVARD